MEPSSSEGRVAQVAARVAERYAMVPTYSEMLAAKAARAAEIAAQAALEAQQAAQAVTDVLWASIESSLEMEQAAEISPEPSSPTPQYRVDPASLPVAPRSQTSAQNTQPRDDVEPHPQIVDPFEDALIAPAQPLPTRLLEFPRELVAARKARPRIAEGPLLNADPDPEQAQLRIFEVASESISRQPISAPTVGQDTLLPEWSSIRLDATPRNIEEEMTTATTRAGQSTKATGRRAGNHGSPASTRDPKKPAAGYSSLLDDMLPVHVAPLQDRILAAAVDALLVVCAFLLFLAVFVTSTAHPPTGKPALVTAGMVLVGFIALYQWLFFTFAESTPGMRFAKIALCTFEDENPSRKTLQYRVAALFLAALPMGLGFLWALLDDDRLGWHDRMTRTYQRSYK
jgi:uncharacterized RDD family membrane protein YckC